MTSNRLRILGAAALAVSLSAAASAAVPETFGGWDANSDAGIDEREFATGFGKNGVFGAWDADRDGALNEDEFGRGLFGRYDRNRDGRIEEPEFGDYNDDVGDGGLWDV